MELGLLLEPRTAYSVQVINNQIIKYAEDTISSRTRYKTHRAGSSCRVWQFIFCILDNLQNRGYGINEMIKCHAGGYYSEGNDDFNHKYNYIIELMIYIYKYAYHNSENHKTLYELVFQNQPIKGIVTEYNNDLSDLPLGNNYMCIYINGMASSIIHYFNIIKVSEEEYYLTSSYGSDFVCVPPYTTPINQYEFKRFLDAMTVDNDLNNMVVANFYGKFFLEKNVGKDILDEDTIEAFPEKRWAKIGVDEGTMEQIKEMIGSENRGNYRIGLMPRYCDYVNELIDNVIPMHESESEYVQNYIAHYGPFTPFIPCAVPGFGEYSEAMDITGGSKKKQMRKRKTVKKTKKNTKKNNKIRKTKRTRSSRSSKRCSR